MVRRVLWFVKQNEYAAPDAMNLENLRLLSRYEVRLASVDAGGLSRKWTLHGDFSSFVLNGGSYRDDSDAAMRKILM